MSKLRENIDRILGNSIRCLLPSYWWKRIFGLVVDEVERVSVSAKNANTKISNISHSLDSEKTSTVRIYDNNPEANKKALEKIAGGYYSNPVRIVYNNSVSTYCKHYWSNDELFCYIIFDDKGSLISDGKQETTYVIRLYKDGTIEKKTHYSQMIKSVDGTLNQLSTNPIQNQVVSKALISKADEADVEQEFKDRETIAIYVPAEGHPLPRLLSGKNSEAIAYKWNSIYGQKEQSWDSIRDDYDKVNKRGVVYVYHGVAYQGNSELDVQYILTQHTALTIEGIEESVNGFTEKRILMRFYDSDNKLCIAKIGGRAEIEVVDIPVDTTNFVEKSEIKTINGQSIIGEGDITIKAGAISINVDTTAGTWSQASDSVTQDKYLHESDYKGYELRINGVKRGFIGGIENVSTNGIPSSYIRWTEIIPQQDLFSKSWINITFENYILRLGNDGKTKGFTKYVTKVTNNAISNVGVVDDNLRFDFAEYDLISGEENLVTNRTRNYTIPKDLLDNAETLVALAGRSSSLLTKSSIKTLNGVSLVGDGDLQLGDGQTIVYDDTAVQSKLVQLEGWCDELYTEVDAIWDEVDTILDDLSNDYKDIYDTLDEHTDEINELHSTIETMTATIASLEARIAALEGN